MAKRISILPENLTNKISAGEVVERPASVIKELLENALDASATSISIEITSGGRRLIKITDNGHGMSRDDALLSLERHATSKIRSESDLDELLTLGFRGEAIPSIASVSRFRLASREPDSIEGAEVIVEGGKIREVKACGMPSGTVISVEQLFFNTPARLKFQKNPETEAGHVGDAVARMAISRPDVAFTYSSDGRELLKLQRGDLLRRLSQTLGKDAAAGLYPLQADNDGVSITGFVSGPAVVRSTSSAMFTYINGRFIRDKVVQHAIMQAYRGVIDRGRYPVLALFIQIPPAEVDVNVHPTKHEVRFRRQSMVHDAIQKGVEDLLRRSPWLGGQQHQDAASTTVPTGQAYRERIAAAAQASLSIPLKTAFSGAYQGGTADSENSLSRGTEKPASLPTVAESEVPFTPDSHPYEVHAGFFSSLAFIGQFHAEYLLCQSDSGLVIIDQHAASERVAYQRLRKQYLSGTAESQRLLFPETVELSFSETEAAIRFNDELTRIGFDLEPFGGNTIVLAAVPRICSGSASVQLVRDLLSDLTSLGTSSAFSESIDSILSRIACHSVIRGKHILDVPQVRELLSAMDQTDFAASCPHGRPVSHVITLAELEKIFKRT